MTDSLADILNGTDTAPEVIQETTPEPISEPTPEPQVDTKSETTAPEIKPEESWTKTAVLDERRKRQELERELSELKGKLEGKEPAKKTDFFEDPDARISEELNIVNSKLFENMLEVTRDLYLESKPDYEEMEQAFIEAAKDNQQLANQLGQAKNPAKFIYETGKQLKKWNDMQDSEAYEARIKAKYEAELREKIMSELQAQKTAKKDAAITPNLTTARSAAKVDHVPDLTLDELFKR